MKSHTYKIISFLIIVVLFTACSKDFLDRQPLDQEVSSNFYQTEEDAMEALTAIYDVLGYQSMPGISWAPFLTVSDMLSDDSFAGGADANDGKDEDELNLFNIPTTNLLVHSIWVKNYTGIYRANLLLEKIVEIDASDEFKTRIIAECKFLRAYFYFEQVRFFENIPLLIETIKGPSEYSQPQSTPEEVYNQIALDLEDAIVDLPTEISLAEAGRISKWAAQALLARVFLFYNGVYNTNLVAGEKMIDQSVVLGYLEELISESGHDLFEDYSTNFKLAGDLPVQLILTFHQ